MWNIGDKLQLRDLYVKEVFIEQSPDGAQWKYILTEGKHYDVYYATEEEILNFKNKYFKQ